VVLLTQISYRTFLLRLRKIAKLALASYGLVQIEPKFVNYGGNGLYQIDVPANKSIPQGTYALRLHQPDYMRREYINSEMDWLSALNQEGIIVPKPVRNMDGNWLVVIDSGYDAPQPRTCTMVRWTRGRLMRKSIRSKHFYSLGKAIAKIHNQARSWKLPKGFVRPHWDWEGLYGDGFDYGFSAIRARETIPKKHQSAFNDTLERIREAEVTMGKSRKSYGLIHADLAFGDNVAIQNGEAIPFDFDDCGYGYWLFDLGVVMAHYVLDTNSKSGMMQDALAKGYEEESTLEQVDWEYLSLFTAARFAQLMFFYQGQVVRNPQCQAEAESEINENAKHLKRILKVMK